MIKVLKLQCDNIMMLCVINIMGYNNKTNLLHNNYYDAIYYMVLF